jgi:hypothetical protein
VKEAVLMHEGEALKDLKYHVLNNILGKYFGPEMRR